MISRIVHIKLKPGRISAHEMPINERGMHLKFPLHRLQRLQGSLLCFLASVVHTAPGNSRRALADRPQCTSLHLTSSQVSST